MIENHRVFTILLGGVMRRKPGVVFGGQKGGFFREKDSPVLFEDSGDSDCSLLGGILHFPD